MNLRKSDVGRQFVAPSGRVVTYVSERGGTYFFEYDDDPTDGLGLTKDGLRILDTLESRIEAGIGGHNGPTLAS